MGQGQAGVKLGDDERRVAVPLHLQHLGELAVLDKRQRRGDRRHLVQHPPVGDQEQLAVSGEHSVACLPRLQAGLVAQQCHQRIAVGDGISQLRLHAFSDSVMRMFR